MRDFAGELRSLADGLGVTGPTWCDDDVVMLRELADFIERGSVSVGLEGRLFGFGYSPAFLEAARDLVARDENGGVWVGGCEKRDGIPVSFWAVAEEMGLDTGDEHFVSDWVWVVESRIRNRSTRALVCLLGP